MVYEWTMASSGNVASATSVSNWLYFNSPEDGARYTKGWFKVVAPDKDGDDNTFKDYNNNPTFAHLQTMRTRDGTTLMAMASYTKVRSRRSKVNITVSHRRLMIILLVRTTQAPRLVRQVLC